MELKGVFEQQFRSNQPASIAPFVDGRHVSSTSFRLSDLTTQMQMRIPRGRNNRADRTAPAYAFGLDSQRIVLIPHRASWIDINKASTNGIPISKRTCRSPNAKSCTTITNNPMLYRAVSIQPRVAISVEKSRMDHAVLSPSLMDREISQPICKCRIGASQDNYRSIPNRQNKTDQRI